MPSKFRKKPVEVEAIQYDGENDAAMIHFTQGAREYFGRRGDWTVKTSWGDFVLVKPDDFAATYEPLEAPLQEGDQ